MWFNLSFKDLLEMSRCIGGKNYDEAIRIISRGLTNSEKDAPSLEMIALCHHWAGRDEAAITFAKQLLSYNARSFAAFEVLGSIYANRSEHETAAKYVRLGLENFPESSPPVPRFIFTLFRLVSFIIPRFRKVAAEAEAEIGDLNKSEKEWYLWAKEYLAWYDKTCNDMKNSTIH